MGSTKTNKKVRNRQHGKLTIRPQPNRAKIDKN